MKQIISVMLSLLLMSCASPEKKAAIKAPMPESQMLSGKKLMLQGWGFRIASKMGITAKVYKAGLYTDKKYESASGILNSPKSKKLLMRFTYTVTKSQLVKGWRKAHKHSCEKNCSESSAALEKFVAAITGMKIAQVMDIVFNKDSVELNIHKNKSGKVVINSAALSHNLLAVFIGKKVISEELKNQLSGHR